MDTFSDFVNVILVVVGIIVAAASAVAFFRVNLAKSQIEALRGDRDDLDDRVERLKAKLEESERKSAKQDEIIASQARNIKHLEKIVTGKEQLDHIQSSLDAHDKRVDERHESVSHNFNVILDQLKSNSELLQTLIEGNQEIQTALLLFLQGGAKK